MPFAPVTGRWLAPSIWLDAHLTPARQTAGILQLGLAPVSGHRVIALSVLVLLGAPPVALAQPKPDSMRTRALCWTARPKPRCALLLLTNLGAYADIPGNARLVEDAGLMVNVSRRDAVGATVYVTMDQDALFARGAALRYRRWLTGLRSLEIGVGARGAARDGGAVMGLVKFNLGPYVGLAVRPAIVRVCDWWAGACMGRRASNFRVSLGVEIGSWVGAVVPALGSVVGLVAVLAHPPNIP